MKVAILWTGGKDSSLACYKAMQQHEVALFVNFVWKKPSLSHPRIITKLQSEALQKPFLWIHLNPPYLESYREAILNLKKEYGIEAVVTGDIGYVDAFHGNWIDDVCEGTGIKVIKPLWGQDRQNTLNELVDRGFNIIFTCVKEPWLTHEWLGRSINQQAVTELQELHHSENLDLCGEFGEYHTMTLDAPFFKKSINIRLFKKQKTENGYIIEPLQFSLVTKKRLCQRVKC
jgi:diphthine-ammonia ligase